MIKIIGNKIINENGEILKNFRVVVKKSNGKAIGYVDYNRRKPLEEQEYTLKKRTKFKERKHKLVKLSDFRPDLNTDTKIGHLNYLTTVDIADKLVIHAQTVLAVAVSAVISKLADFMKLTNTYEQLAVIAVLTTGTVLATKLKTNKNLLSDFLKVFSKEVKTKEMEFKKKNGHEPAFLEIKQGGQAIRYELVYIEKHISETEHLVQDKDGQIKKVQGTVYKLIVEESEKNEAK